MSIDGSRTVAEKHDSILQVWGGASLQGEVQISGAKNSALLVMAASLLSSADCCLHNIPKLSDVEDMAEVLRCLGVKIDRHRDRLEINPGTLDRVEAPSRLVQQLRASFFILGSLLSRFGQAHVPLPGGCAIGARPVNLHLQGLRLMGAEITIEQGVVRAWARRRRLHGAMIDLDYPSVGATATLMMAATLAEGETVIANAAQEPEIVDLARFCGAMGAKIRGAGTRMIVISGVSRLHGAEYRIIPDRIEAGTFLVAGAITRSPITLTAVNARHLMPVIDKLRAIGTNVVADTIGQLRVLPGARYQGTIIQTGPHPGFPTDMQAQMMSLLSLSSGKSTVVETVFENRLQHVTELNRLGADIRVKGNCAVIQGVSKLSGTSVTATDLRASAALVVAALVAENVTTIQGLHHLDRGYEKLENKLRQLGACLQRVPYARMIDLEPAEPATGSATGSATTTAVISAGIGQSSPNQVFNAEVA